MTCGRLPVAAKRGASGTQNDVVNAPRHVKTHMQLQNPLFAKLKERRTYEGPAKIESPALALREDPEMQLASY